MRVGLAADHAGTELKADLLKRLAPFGHELVDLGGDGSNQADDYPEYARKIGLAVLDGTVDRGILICGSGVGASVAASKIPGIRAAVCHDTYSAAQGVEHDDMNVLTLGSRVIGVELALACSIAFLRAQFSGAERHVRRLGEIRKIEEQATALAAAHHKGGSAPGSAPTTTGAPSPGDDAGASERINEAMR